MAAEGPVEVGSEVGSALISALGSMGSALAAVGGSGGIEIR